MSRKKANHEKIAVIVAHPDDETLWVGGLLLAGDFGSCFILSLCRAGDSDRAPRFKRALEQYGAMGAMADLDDGPDQKPLPPDLPAETILKLLPDVEYGRIYTHSPDGEYTRHLRHEETGRAVLKLWLEGRIRAGKICLFAYEDGNRSYLPRPIERADVVNRLPDYIRKEKYRIIREIYNFDEHSFEAGTTPGVEAFWVVETEDEALLRL